MGGKHRHGEEAPSSPRPSEVAEAILREGRRHVTDDYARKQVRQGSGPWCRDRALASEEGRVEKGSLAAEAERAEDLKGRPEPPEAVRLVKERLEEELGPGKAEELADQIIIAAAEKMSRQPPQKLTADPIQVMKDAESELVKREASNAVVEHGSVRPHSLAAKVQSVTDRAAEGGQHPLVLEKVRERLERQDIKGD
eukprot:scaffold14.g1105.t1